MLVGILGEAGSGKDTAAQFLVKEKGFYSLALADPIKVYCNWMFGWTAEQLWGESARRNEEDARYPFHRCPSCGFTAYNLGLDPDAHTAQCGVCFGQRTPREWASHLAPRYALQSLGDWARALFEDAYIEFALARAEAVQQRGVDFDPLWDILERLEVTDDRWPHSALTLPVPRVLISDVRLKNEVEGIRKAGGQVYRIVRDVKDGQGKEDTTSSGISAHNSEMEQREILDDELDGVIDNSGTLEDLYYTLNDLVTVIELSKE